MLRPRFPVRVSLALLAIAMAAIAADFLRARGMISTDIDAAPAATFLSLFLLARFGIGAGDVGWRILPRQGLWYWCRAIAVIGGIISLFCALFLVTRSLTGIHFRAEGFRRLSDFWDFCLYALILSPIIEEILYRGLLCPPIAALAGSWCAIFVSGSLFAAVHFARGNPAPTNFVAGFFLAWVFLKSESIVLPMIVHALGNLVVGLCHLLLLYYPDWTF